jgi:hypothetical protein
MTFVNGRRAAMRLKLRGGTAREDEPPLCLSCRHATVIQGRNLHDELIDCGLLHGHSSRITFPVRACSGYDDRRHATLWHMETIAWVLRTERKSRKIGFVPARELKPDLRHVLDDEDW